MVEKFAADAMLGRLARWLRLLGYDTFYRAHITDAELLRVALGEDRLVLTRDHRLARRRLARGRCLLLKAQEPREQLREVLQALGLRPRGRPLCPRCGGPLRRLPRQRARALVPEHVYFAQERFFRCAGCGHPYWEGTQHRRFSQLVNDIIRKNAP
mgnify:CR=1 FL=1